VDLASRSTTRSSNLRYALVEVPPFSDNPIIPTRSPGLACARGRLSNSSRWVLPSPLFVQLHSGTITVVSRDFSQLDPAEATPTNDRDPLIGHSIQPPSGFPDYLGIRHQLLLKEIACGPLALIPVLRDLGVSVGNNDTTAFLSVAGSVGTDLLTLQDLARTKGMYTLGLSITPTQLRKSGKHAVVLLDGIGFAAVLGYAPDGFRVVYPGRLPGILPDEVFQASYPFTPTFSVVDTPGDAWRRVESPSSRCWASCARTVRFLPRGGGVV